MVEGFLDHRLSRAELVSLAAGPPDEKLLDRFLAEDVVGPVDAQPLRDALEKFGLGRPSADNRVWTREERALVRRLGVEDGPRPAPAQPQLADPALVKPALQRFAEWDLDHDGRVDARELDTAMARCSADPQEAAVLVTWRYYGWRTAEELRTLASQPSEQTAEVNASFRAYRRRAEAMPAAGPLEQECFDPLQVRQGADGTCMFLSSLAHVEAAELKRRCHDNGDGTFQIELGNGQSRRVRDLSLAERLHHASTREGGRWPGLMELAVGEWNSQPSLRELLTSPWKIGRYVVSLWSPPSPRQANERGLNSLEASDAAYGRRGTLASPTVRTPQQIREVLASGRVRTAGTESQPLHNGLQSAHSYSVLGFDPGSDEVVLRNPWGCGGWKVPSPNGIFRMPLRDFYASFDLLRVEKEPQTPSS